MDVTQLSPAMYPVERLPEEWATVLAAWGEPRYRALQVFRWIHKRGVMDPALMTDLPASLREKLAADGLAAPMKIADVLESGDGTRKLLVEMTDGKRVESVLIPRGSVDASDVYSSSGADADERVDGSALPVVTQCISSQVGCAMGCAFCASGIAGLKRHMSAAEIVAQVLIARQWLGDSARLGGVVFMGMGEPLHNYSAVSRALVLLNHPEGTCMSLRRVTVSTSGLVPEIDKLARDFRGQVQLAISLHAPNTETRSRIMPINKKYPLHQLMAALRRYPLPKTRRITIEYTLIAGINDTTDAAEELVNLLGNLQVHVNLIPMNPVDGAGLSAPSWDDVERFQAVLRQRGVETFVRRRKGDDIAAACGQLALHGEKRKVRLITAPQ